MEFLKFFGYLILALCCIAIYLKNNYSRRNHPISKDVRIIFCLSPNLPRESWGRQHPQDYVGVISPKFPGKCMIPTKLARDAFQMNLEIPEWLPKSVSLPGFQKMRFFPFREFAESLGYDVLWCTFKESGSKNYTGHVLFAEHMRSGVWIRVSEDYAHRNFGDLYCDDLYTGGWLYASLFGTHSLPASYIVQRRTDQFYISPDDVLEVVRV